VCAIIRKGQQSKLTSRISCFQWTQVSDQAVLQISATSPPGSRRDDLNIHRLTIIQSIMRMARYRRKYHVQASVCACVGTQRKGIGFTIERKQRRASDGGGVVRLQWIISSLRILFLIESLYCWVTHHRAISLGSGESRNRCNEIWGFAIVGECRRHLLRGEGD